ncbi:MAG: hypothetical protein K2J90_04340 [Lachnospiraceae bacterium]|nr:hypothetical protein [Lachnospiraceae bacterium]
MGKGLKKICLIGSFVFIMCFMAGCGSDGEKQELESIEQRALEEKIKAEETIDKVNEDTKKLNENAENLDKE